MGVSTSRWPSLDPAASARPRPWRARTLLLVGLGGAVGTTVRSQLGMAFPTVPGTWPWPWTTFAVNVSGALLLGALLETLSLLGPDAGWRRRVRLGVGTGVLGGFTTYSSFVVETVTLGRDGHALAGAGYDLASLLFGFASAYAGTLLVSRTHHLVRRPQTAPDR